MGKYWNNLTSTRRFYPSPVTSHFPSAPETGYQLFLAIFLPTYPTKKRLGLEDPSVTYFFFYCQKDLLILYDPFHPL